MVIHTGSKYTNVLGTTYIIIQTIVHTHIFTLRPKALAFPIKICEWTFTSIIYTSKDKYMFHWILNKHQQKAGGGACPQDRPDPKPVYLSWGQQASQAIDHLFTDPNTMGWCNYEDITLMLHLVLPRPNFQCSHSQGMQI